MQAQATTHASAPSPYATAPLPRAPPHAIAPVNVRGLPVGVGGALTQTLIVDLSSLGIIGCVRSTYDDLLYAMDVMTLCGWGVSDGNQMLRRMAKDGRFPKVNYYLPFMKRCIFYASPSALM
jgi:hypothetical protein